MPKFILLGTIALALFLTTGCKNELPPEQTVDYEKDVKPLIESTETRQVRGSCSFIDTQSFCIDFIGEIYTEDRIKMSCVDGKFSLDACPYSDLGGCQSTPGTMTESIAWSYNYGGQPISAEEANDQAAACNALGIAKWVLPHNLLGK